MGPRTNERSGLLQVVIAAVIWGSIPLLVRATVAHPVVIVFYRVLFAGLLIGGYGLVSHRLDSIRSLPKRTLLALVGMGALLALNWVLFFTAITLVDVSVAVLLAYVGPVLVAFLNPIVTGASFDRRVIVPLILALGGTVTIAGPSHLALGGTAALGAGLAFLSALTYASLVVNAKRLISNIDPVVYMTVEYGTAGILLLPAVFFLQGPASMRELGAVAVLGIVHTGLTGLLFLSALKVSRADHAAILTYAEPVSAVLFAAVFLGEPLTLTTVLGGGAVIAGGAMVASLRSAASVEGPPVLLEHPNGERT